MPLYKKRQRILGICLENTKLHQPCQTTIERNNQEAKPALWRKPKNQWVGEREQGLASPGAREQCAELQGGCLPSDSCTRLVAPIRTILGAILDRNSASVSLRMESGNPGWHRVDSHLAALIPN